ncbi:NAD(P)-dependent oxidoreductase [Flavobacterium sp.]|uniref:NAD(P)-dependent oxidoreductase n=1 Tax=Flavobacterium sp. TaxID=239 RepID=UPI002C381336|nr:NAD(P)-dependent oxidoreductase [Flavobacterium sp.]HSD05955.1 NAD(P)-dependent oxidoreductase [Flavobacterium sp.]
MNKPKIGWIGLGNMGNPMVKNLLKANYEVTVYNRTKDKEHELINLGATSASSPQELIEKCDTVFTMLSNDEAVKEVFENQTGLLAKTENGKLIINMSTISPQTTKYLAEIANKHNIKFLDAPVSGSVKPAQDGTLLILVGGSSENYERAKPLFDILGKSSLLLGETGAGSSAKLAINYFLGLNIQGLAETVLFAEKNGVSRKDMLTIINKSACGNGITEIKTPSILFDQYPAAFALKHLHKDLNLAKNEGLDSPLFQPLFESFQHAKDNGLGEEDVMAIIKIL